MKSRRGTNPGGSHFFPQLPGRGKHMLSPDRPGRAPAQVAHRHAPVCRNCGAKIRTKRRGRRAKYCSASCRVDASRQLNFGFAKGEATKQLAQFENGKTPAGALKNPARNTPSRVLRNGKNPPAISDACRAEIAGRASAIKGLWRSIINVEVIAPHQWTEVTSADGVVSQVATLRPPALCRERP